MQKFIKSHIVIIFISGLGYTNYGLTLVGDEVSLVA
jgi:hypothetical protein